MDIVHLLPDAVANQIAAGEVIQRPASVIKELVENSIDAGATLVSVIVKGAGRTSIQVVDNGKGMSTTDARMAFERHATSKISSADDLFSLATMGFRGEALASIAAVAQVELRTCVPDAPLGTLIRIEGSQVTCQEMVQCPVGTNFIISNLFFNVPARRKFLKKDETELRNIVQEFQRIALAHPSVALSLRSESDIIYDLPIGSFKQRILDVFSRKTRNIATQLIDVHAESPLVHIEGFVSSPQGASRSAHNFFFVNDRYMNHPYFRRAVISAFDGMIRPDEVPMFFLSLHVDPQTIDVNIHPTKTEIKFENEREIWQIIVVAIKEALGKFNIVPSLDFDTADRIEIPVAPASAAPASVKSQPMVSFDEAYNPFTSYRETHHTDTRNWQQLFQSSLSCKKTSAPEPCQETLFPSSSTSEIRPLDFSISSSSQTVETEGCGDDGSARVMVSPSDYITMQHGSRYICVSLSSGLHIIDVPRALNRIYYDDILCMVRQHSSVSQKLLFPEIVELSSEDTCLFTEMEMDLATAGFEISPFGKNIYRIESIPAMLPEGADVQAIITLLVSKVKEMGTVTDELIHEQIAESVASVASRSASAVVSLSERNSIVSRLFASSNPNYTPRGARIIATIDSSLIDNLFRI